MRQRYLGNDDAIIHGEDLIDDTVPDYPFRVARYDVMNNPQRLDALKVNVLFRDDLSQGRKDGCPRLKQTKAD